MHSERANIKAHQMLEHILLEITRFLLISSAEFGELEDAGSLDIATNTLRQNQRSSKKQRGYLLVELPILGAESR